MKKVESVRFQAEGAAHQILWSFGWVCARQEEPSVGYCIDPPRGGMQVLLAEDVRKMRDFFVAAAKRMGVDKAEEADLRPYADPSYGLDSKGEEV